jgi:hypothetical protein
MRTRVQKIKLGPEEPISNQSWRVAAYRKRRNYQRKKRDSWDVGEQRG